MWRGKLDNRVLRSDKMIPDPKLMMTALIIYLIYRITRERSEKMGNEYISKADQPIYELLEHLYFVEGLEDIKHLKEMQTKHIREWCENHGEKLSNIIFALIMERNPKYILEKIQKEGEKKNEKQHKTT